MIKKHQVSKDFLNSRLDKWFKKNICDVPQSLLEKNIRIGKIKVNGKRTKSSYKLQTDDVIFLNNFNPVIKKNNYTLNKYKPTKKEMKSSSDFVIHNNDDFVVINKPSGISVQSGTKSKKNIMDMLRFTKYFKDSVPYTVHRIDKDTTGILIVAKNRKSAQLFTSLFRVRKIYKTYLGIVLGKFKELKGKLEDELFYYENDKKIISKAITNFKVVDSNYNYSLVELNPYTGRKHQLRKQLLIHNHPIIGDAKYSLPNKLLKNKSKLMLHAYKISFSINNIRHEYIADLPIAFQNTLKEKNLKNF